MQKLALTKSGTFWLKPVLSHCGWSFFHYYSWFSKNFTRAFKRDIICLLILMERLSKLLKCFSENQLCGILCPWVYAVLSEILKWRIITHLKVLKNSFRISNKDGKSSIHSVTKLVWMKKYHFQKLRAKGTLDLRLTQFRVCNQLELLWSF